MPHTLTVRATYADTDQMGMVYYGNYFTWFEMGRTELLRTAGLAYRAVEQQGVFLPVRESYCKYQKSVRYDDEIAVKTWLTAATSATIRFDYEISKENAVLATGYTVHFFMNLQGRPIKPPKNIMAVIKSVSERSLPHAG